MAEVSAKTPDQELASPHEDPTTPQTSPHQEESIEKCDQVSSVGDAPQDDEED